MLIKDNDQIIKTLITLKLENYELKSRIFNLSENTSLNFYEFKNANGFLTLGTSKEAFAATLLKYNTLAHRRFLAPEIIARSTEGIIKPDVFVEVVKDYRALDQQRCNAYYLAEIFFEQKFSSVAEIEKIVNEKAYDENDKAILNFIRLQEQKFIDFYKQWCLYCESESIYQEYVNHFLHDLPMGERSAAIFASVTNGDITIFNSNENNQLFTLFKVNNQNNEQRLLLLAENSSLCKLIHSAHHVHLLWPIISQTENINEIVDAYNKKQSSYHQILPNEIILNIMDFALPSGKAAIFPHSYKAICNLGSINKHFNALFKSDVLWRNKLKEVLFEKYGHAYVNEAHLFQSVRFDYNFFSKFLGNHDGSHSGSEIFLKKESHPYLLLLKVLQKLNSLDKLNSKTFAPTVTNIINVILAGNSIGWFCLLYIITYNKDYFEAYIKNKNILGKIMPCQDNSSISIKDRIFTKCLDILNDDFPQTELLYFDSYKKFAAEHLKNTLATFVFQNFKKAKETLRILSINFPQCSLDNEVFEALVLTENPLKIFTHLQFDSIKSIQKSSLGIFLLGKVSAEFILTEKDSIILGFLQQNRLNLDAYSKISEDIILKILFSPNADLILKWNVSYLFCFISTSKAFEKEITDILCSRDVTLFLKTYNEKIPQIFPISESAKERLQRLKLLNCDIASRLHEVFRKIPSAFGALNAKKLCRLITNENILNIFSENPHYITMLSDVGLDKLEFVFKHSLLWPLLNYKNVLGRLDLLALSFLISNCQFATIYIFEQLSKTTKIIFNHTEFVECLEKLLLLEKEGFLRNFFENKLAILDKLTHQDLLALAKNSETMIDLCCIIESKNMVNVSPIAWIAILKNPILLRLFSIEEILTFAEFKISLLSTCSDLFVNWPSEDISKFLKSKKLINQSEWECLIKNPELIKYSFSLTELLSIKRSPLFPTFIKSYSWKILLSHLSFQEIEVSTDLLVEQPFFIYSDTKKTSRSVSLLNAIFYTGCKKMWEEMFNKVNTLAAIQSLINDSNLIKKLIQALPSCVEKIFQYNSFSEVESLDRIKLYHDDLTMLDVLLSFPHEKIDSILKIFSASELVHFSQSRHYLVNIILLFPDNDWKKAKDSFPIWNYFFEQEIGNCKFYEILCESPFLVKTISQMIDVKHIELIEALRILTKENLLSRLLFTHHLNRCSQVENNSTCLYEALRSIRDHHEGGKSVLDWLLDKENQFIAEKLIHHGEIQLLNNSKIFELLYHAEKSHYLFLEKSLSLSYLMSLNPFKNDNRSISLLEIILKPGTSQEFENFMSTIQTGDDSQSHVGFHVKELANLLLVVHKTTKQPLLQKRIFNFIEDEKSVKRVKTNEISDPIVDKYLSFNL